MSSTNSSNKQNAIDEFISRIEDDGASFADGLINKFNEEEGLKEKALTYLFQELPQENKDKRVILVKVACLNDLYSTRLNSNRPQNNEDPKKAADVATMAKHICELEESDSLNSKIRDGNSSAVTLIRHIPNKEELEYRDAYSFATKYCSWHNHEAYPIVDGYTKAMVYYIYNHLKDNNPSPRKITQPNLSDYGTFCEAFNVINAWIKNHCDNKSYGTKEIDKLLWYYAAREKQAAKIYI